MLEILKSKNTYREFFEEEIGELSFTSVSEYLDLMIKEKKLKKSEVIEKANLDKYYAYQIFNGTKENPSRDKLIMLAFGMGLNLNETRKLLKLCGAAELYARSPRDSIIIFCLEKRNDLLICNEYLHDFSLEILE